MACLPPSPALPATSRLAFGPHTSLSCEQLEAAALEPAHPISLSDEARAAMQAAHGALRQICERGDSVYGVTTGFGPLADYASADGGRAAHGYGLLAHLSTGTGAWAPKPIVRATAFARVQTIAQGYSAVDPSIVDAYLDLFRHDLWPAVPEVGSLGASGDLTPLAHIARVLTGDGFIIEDGARRPAADALARAGLEPVALSGRNALGLVNGTSFMTAYASLAVARAARLLAYAERLTGWAYRLLGCTLEPLDERLNRARGHIGQVRSAEAIRTEALRHGPYDPTPARPFQEPYSLRCAPQVLGACRDQLAYVRSVVTTELNGADDNPIITTDPATALHGGNFQGQHVGFAADALNACLTQIGVLAERQVDLLLKPQHNGGAPLLLSWCPGASSGLAGAQLTATALVAELRHHAQLASTSSIPSNGGNQDVVSMGTLAARTAYSQTERLAPILAVLGMALKQLTHLRTSGRAEGPTTPVPDWMPDVQPLEGDRALYDDIARISEQWLTPPPVEA